jgi:Uma2 family endonuclease
MSIAVPTTYTPEDLLEMPDGELYELVDGQLVERSMGTESQWVSGKLFRLLADYVESRQLGWGFPDGVGYQCFPGDPGRVRKPDGSFIRMGRLPNEELPRGHCRIAPDLAIEVVSPNDLYSEVNQKVHEYLEAGVALVWVLDPDSRSVMVHRLNGDPSSLNESSELSGEKVIPDFSCPVRELFPPRHEP